MRTSDFDYDLPPQLIAQSPLESREASRLLVYDRATDQIAHRHFSQLNEYLRAGDILVLNQSRVIPARLRGRRNDTGGKVELLLLHREHPGIWQALCKPSRRLHSGVIVTIQSPDGGLRLEAEILTDDQNNIKKVHLDCEERIDQLGETPLPPYIHERLEDPERYQTVYSRHKGSVAAPTAGLHFSKPMLDKLERTGIELAFVTLHVGLDTFRPVYTEDPAEHKIHSEYYELDAETAKVLNRARQEGRRIIAVGTTSVRLLEQVTKRMAELGHHQLEPSNGQADLFILPGHRFKIVDAVLTNFHIPRSSLLMLISAFAGREQILRAYQKAIAENYRFYSFGDCMLIL
jgi:S-adenosylmethionine:tRNA ribosyltransferase-isomerase